MNNETSVLVVDDDEDIRYAIKSIFKKCGCIVNGTGSVEEALEALSDNHYDIVLCDMRFHGEMGGEELLTVANQRFTDTDVVLISCAMDDKQIAHLMSLGAAYCLQKPFFTNTCLNVLDALNSPQYKAA